ncbi:MAG: 2-amino-4-ketopentanoate thiolase [Thermosediminibacteraceae bacterium]|nr:2-amino-4-ketopentanoate thiolase [Thermosediminibacteraceae bacterium]
MKAKKGMWVEVENIVLRPGERAPHLPEDTKRVPLVMWVKGFLESDVASLGDNVKVRTLTGRIVEGKLVTINPRHVHDFGDCVEELLQVGEEVKKELEKVLKEEDSDER